MLAAAGGPLLAAVLAVGATGCASSARRPAAAVTSTSAARPAVPAGGPSVQTAPATTGPVPAAGATTAVAPTTAVPPGPPASTTSRPPAGFSAEVVTVTAADLPYTWHPGCPVPPSQLRAILLTYWGFDGAVHPGRIVVNANVVPAVESVFRTLYEERFPLREVVPEDAYRGDDNAAAAADDTSGFNCRDAVAPGPPQWSVHAFGEAIDVNDVENPYLDGSQVIPPAGRPYLDRADVRPGMAVAGRTVVAAFAAVGWQWGGRWTGSPDYQHFSATGG